MFENSKYDFFESDETNTQRMKIVLDKMKDQILIDKALRILPTKIMLTVYRRP